MLTIFKTKKIYIHLTNSNCVPGWTSTLIAPRRYIARIRQSLQSCFVYDDECFMDTLELVKPNMFKVSRDAVIKKKTNTIISSMWSNQIYDGRLEIIKPDLIFIYFMNGEDYLMD